MQFASNWLEIEDRATRSIWNTIPHIRLGVEQNLLSIDLVIFPIRKATIFDHNCLEIIPLTNLLVAGMSIWPWTMLLNSINAGAPVAILVDLYRNQSSDSTPHQHRSLSKERLCQFIMYRVSVSIIWLLKQRLSNYKEPSTVKSCCKIKQPDIYVNKEYQSSSTALRLESKHIDILKCVQ